MYAIVVYESMYGNTHAVAEAIAAGLGDAEALPAREASSEAIAAADLLVVGGPTHMHGLASTKSRLIAVDRGQLHGHRRTEAGAGEHPGLRDWLRDLPKAARGGRAAAFDTRLRGRPLLTGSAARGIARRLRFRGYEVVATASFVMADGEGPIEEAELERARAWGASLAASVAAVRVPA